MAMVLKGFLLPDTLGSMALHPTQIYSSFNAIVLAALAVTYFRYRARNGEVLALGMLTYPITRFSIEYLRGDEMGKFGTGLTISQLVSLGIFCAGLAFVFWLSRRPRQSTPLSAHSSPPGPKRGKQPAGIVSGSV
jgi:phosphatidylglycerol:prolipoprotein diacylglycerol transferase